MKVLVNLTNRIWWEVFTYLQIFTNSLRTRIQSLKYLPSIIAKHIQYIHKIYTILVQRIITSRCWIYVTPIWREDLNYCFGYVLEVWPWQVNPKYKTNMFSMNQYKTAYNPWTYFQSRSHESLNFLFHYWEFIPSD